MKIWQTKLDISPAYIDPAIKDIVLLVIKGSHSSYENLELKINTRDIQDRRVVGAEYIFVDTTYRNVLDNKKNQE